MSVLLLLLLLLQYLALKVCAAAFTYESGASDQRMIVDLAKKITCKRKGPKKGEHSSYPRIWTAGIPALDPRNTLVLSFIYTQLHYLSHIIAVTFWLFCHDTNSSKLLRVPHVIIKSWCSCTRSITSDRLLTRSTHTLIPWKVIYRSIIQSVKFPDYNYLTNWAKPSYFLHSLNPFYCFSITFYCFSVKFILFAILAATFDFMLFSHWPPWGLHTFYSLAVLD